MPNPLSNLYDVKNTGGLVKPNIYTNAANNLRTRMQTLPYGGGTYNPSVDGGAIAPSPIFTGASGTEQASDLYEKYRDPKTGEVMSPEEYAIYIGNKVPKGTGEVSNYAGNALANPNQTANQLRTQATNLNNSRNDIATGATDPYKAGAQSGIAYSPAELKAIEKAYAGIYDPALNDVFSRLKDKETADAKVAAMEARVFSTNESIRLWKATTGTKSSGTSSGYKFTNSDIKNGARNSGMGLEAFNAIEDDDVKLFFVNPPKDIDTISGKSYPMNVTFDNLIMQALEGEVTPEEASDEILSSNIPNSVQHYFIDQLPLEAVDKEGYFSKIWKAITGK